MKTKNWENITAEDTQAMRRLGVDYEFNQKGSEDYHSGAPPYIGDKEQKACFSQLTQLATSGSVRLMLGRLSTTEELARRKQEAMSAPLLPQ